MGLRVKLAEFIMPKGQQQASAIPQRSGDPVSAFYSKRQRMDKSDYDGLQNELSTAKKEIHAAWHGGQAAIRVTSDDQFRKITQLILLHPGNRDLAKYIDQDTTELQARKDIVRATAKCQRLGITVKWFDGPFSIITVIDPDDPEWARVRVEPWLVYVRAAEWQNYVIYQKHNTDAYKIIKDAFDAMWKQAKDAPKGNELEEYGQEKPSHSTPSPSTHPT